MSHANLAPSPSSKTKGASAPSADVAAIRARARQHLDDGAVIQSYGADREAVLRMLNEALATEIVCMLRYRRHHFMAKGINAEPIAAEFLTHATEELGHADSICARIVQLGGEPDLSPDTLSARSHAEYIPAATLAEMVKENLVAERIAIESYGDMIRYLGDKDVTTRRLLEQILAVEEEHADELADLLARN